MFTDDGRWTKTDGNSSLGLETKVYLRQKGEKWGEIAKGHFSKKLQKLLTERAPRRKPIQTIQ